ncbi:hypothetical protein DL89DRAFT_90263 [Linderina pennispora]|uniref:RanBP2-type domain-containing protein n=1 Tax=Linderina pennispora TaxID=61395 RepID=A0A1Y1WIE0_9FUNG|nr:uncharacterized protein DL89DRAFT_90263 [Linderina pennispora]ORX73242.1 hypothetical protein DL89DRAFT_90263 [Linderina pennispora]
MPSAITTRPQPVTVRALTAGQSQLPQFSFTLQVPELAKTPVKRKISQMDASELPAFDFTLGVKRQAVDPPKSTAATATPPVQDPWNQPAAAKSNQWKCSICDCVSPDSADKCIVCEGPKPTSAPAAKTLPASVENPVQDLWSQPAAVKNGQWKCSVCDLLSPDSADKCTVCEAPKPGPTPVAPTPAPAPDCPDKRCVEASLW